MKIPSALLTPHPSPHLSLPVSGQPRFLTCSLILIACDIQSFAHFKSHFSRSTSTTLSNYSFGGYSDANYCILRTLIRKCLGQLDSNTCIFQVLKVLSPQFMKSCGTKKGTWKSFFFCHKSPSGYQYFYWGLWSFQVLK